MKLIEDNRERTGWITAVIEGRWCQAKVYDDPSIHGINEGRISKLAICKYQYRNPRVDFLDQMDFNYDRGLDFDNLQEGLLDKIVSKLETLPKAFTSNAPHA